MPPTSTTHRTAILCGGTGLVGSQILNALLADRTVSTVHLLSRRALPIEDARVHVHVVDFHRLPPLPQADEVYLALGTTIKVAGSQQAFRAVDLEANLAVARAAVEAGARRIAVVSAVGADSRSAVFYNRVKGELEDALKSLDLAALVVAQPSLLLGDRDALKQPLRLGEKLANPIAQLLAPITSGRYRPVQAQAVARALVRTLPGATGTVVLPSDEAARRGADDAA